MADDTKKSAPVNTSSAPATAPEPSREYFFPQHGITITAASREDAEKQLEAQLSTSEKSNV